MQIYVFTSSFLDNFTVKAKSAKYFLPTQKLTLYTSFIQYIYIYSDSVLSDMILLHKQNLSVSKYVQHVQK